MITKLNTPSYRLFALGLYNNCENIHLQIYREICWPNLMSLLLERFLFLLHQATMRQKPRCVFSIQMHSQLPYDHTKKNKKQKTTRIPGLNPCFIEQCEWKTLDKRSLCKPLLIDNVCMLCTCIICAVLYIVVFYEKLLKEHQGKDLWQQWTLA